MSRALPILGFCLVLSWLAAMRLVSAQDDDELGPPPTIDGAWRWDFTMPDGTVVRPKVILTSTNGRLIGVTSFRPGSEAPITNGFLSGDKVRFQVIRERDGHAIVTTYTGKLTDKSIVGAIESNWTGDAQSHTYPWEAQRAHLGIEGIWMWTNAIGSRPPRTGGGVARGGSEGTTRVALQQDGEKVTGKTVSRSGRPVAISRGSLTNNEVYFEIERSFREVKSLSKFRGKQSGETISGSMELELNGKVRKAAWEARRIN